MANRVQVLKPTAAKFLANNPNTPNPHYVPVKKLDGTNGPLTIVQRIQAAYKTVVAFVGSLLILLTQVQVLTPFIPEQYRGYIGVGIAVLTTVSTFLTQNQKFVEEL